MTKFLSGLFGLLAVVIALNFADASANADPEIGQPAVGYRLSVTKLDTTGDDTVLQDCTPANKLFFLTAKIKRGTPGRFIQVGSSFARIKLTSGEVMKATGTRGTNGRRIVFVLKSSVPTGTSTIDRAGNNYVMVATNNPLGKVNLRSVGVLCVVNG